MRDGDVASYAEYREMDGTRVITHTVTEPAFRRQGLASALIAHVLADLRESGLRVVGLCPFVHQYLVEHPEHADLVDLDLDERLR